MKKTYKIDVDCANCANKMEEAAKNTAGVKDATVNFMMLKMIVEFEDGQDPKAVMKDVLKNCKKVEAIYRNISRWINFFAGSPCFLTESSQSPAGVANIRFTDFIRLTTEQS